MGEESELDGYFTFEGLVSPWCITSWACGVSAAGPTNRTIRFFPPPLPFRAPYRSVAALLHERGPEKKRRIDLTRLEDEKSDVPLFSLFFFSLSPSFLLAHFLSPNTRRSRVSAFRSESATIFPEMIQIVIPADWIEMLAARIVLMKYSAIILIQKIPQRDPPSRRKCRLLFPTSCLHMSSISFIFRRFIKAARL